MKNSIPPHFVLHKSKEVIFYIPNGMPTTMGIPTFLKDLGFPDYKGLVMKSKCMFKKLKDGECDE